MSAIGDSTYLEDWKQIARKDWKRAHLLLDADDYEGTAYFLQQAIEKFLKAWLLERGWTLAKTHELGVLLADATTHDTSLTSFRPVCVRLAGYYFSQRYPSLMESELSREEVESDIAQATALINHLFPAESW